MPPVVVKTCYDGDQFGELAIYLKDINRIMTHKNKKSLNKMLNTNSTLGVYIAHKKELESRNSI